MVARIHFPRLTVFCLLSRSFAWLVSLDILFQVSTQCVQVEDSHYFRSLHNGDHGYSHRGLAGGEAR